MQLGNYVWEIRLNTYVDSIELSKVIRTALNFPAANSNGSGRSRNSLQCTRTLSNQMNVGCPVGAGLQFFADVRPGRMLQKFPGYVLWPAKGSPESLRGGRQPRLAVGSRAQSNRRIPDRPNADFGCSGIKGLVCDSSGPGHDRSS
jgi:hypothetical protein